MYTTKVSKTKTLAKANNNYRPYGTHGKKHAIQQRAKRLAYKNNPDNAIEIKEHKALLKSKSFIRQQKKACTKKFEQPEKVKQNTTLFTYMKPIILVIRKKAKENRKISLNANKIAKQRFKELHKPMKSAALHKIQSLCNDGLLVGSIPTRDTILIKRFNSH